MRPLPCRGSVSAQGTCGAWRQRIEEALEALEVPSEALTEDEPIEISGGVKMACV